MGSGNGKGKGNIIMGSDGSGGIIIGGNGSGIRSGGIIRPGGNNNGSSPNIFLYISTKQTL